MVPAASRAYDVTNADFSQTKNRAATVVGYAMHGDTFYTCGYWVPDGCTDAFGRNRASTLRLDVVSEEFVVGRGTHMDSQMDSRHSRQQAARCLQIAEATPSAKLKGVLLAEAEAWNNLAADQEWLEQRAIDRQEHDALSMSASDAAEATAFRRVA